MPQWTYPPKLEIFLRQAMADIPNARPGKMFGYPGYKVNGKLAVSLFDTGIIVKVGEARAQTLLTAGQAEPFEPMPGRVWKDWVLITGNLETHRPLLAEAVAYVQQETGG